jgi:uncharacterized membrane protein
MESMAYAQTGTATSGSGWTLKDFVLLPYYILRFFYNRYADFYRDFKSLFGGRASRAWLMMGVVALLPFLVFIVIGVLSSLGFIVYLNDTAMDYFDYRNRIDNLMINSFLIGFAVHWLAIIVTALWKMRSFPKFDIRMGVRIAKNSFLLLVIHYFATLLLFS